MNRLLATLALVLCGCAASRTEAVLERGPYVTQSRRRAAAGPGPTAALAQDAGRADVVEAGAAADAGAISGERKEQAISLLVQAAETDLNGPFIGGLSGDELDRAIRQAADDVGVKFRMVKRPPLVEVVTAALAHVDTPRSQDALIAWARNKRASRYTRPHAIWQLLHRPQQRYLQTFEQLLAEGGGNELGGLFADQLGSLGEALGLRGSTPASASILLTLRELGTPEALALIKRVATDRSRTGPSREVLRAMKEDCTRGLMVEFEAKALASERLIALSLLDDKELIRQARDDPSEPRFFRVWCAYMLKGSTPWKGSPEWWERYDLQIAAPCILL